MTKVAIVTPIHNRREITLQCLRSLSRIDRSSFEVSIYVVDDGSTDGSAEAIASEFPEVIVVPGDGNLWYTEGTNVGMRAALEDGADFVLAINDDSVFHSRFLEHLIETATSNPRSVVGPLLLLWDEPHRLFQTAPVWKTFEGGWKHWDQQTVWTIPQAAWEVDLIVGNCVLYPRAAFEECGLMNSRKFPNFGDAEFTPRLKRAGFQLIIDPRSRVFCQPNAMPQRLRDRTFSELLKLLIFDLKYPSNLTRIFLSHTAGGPSFLQGTAAFTVFLGKAVASTFRSRSTTEKAPPERPLSEVFAQYVLTRE